MQKSRTRLDWITVSHNMRRALRFRIGIILDPVHSQMMAKSDCFLYQGYPFPKSHANTSMATLLLSNRVHRQNQAHEQTPAFAVISRSPLCCNSNETRAPIASPLNSAQLGGTPALPFLQLPKLHPGPCSSAGMRRGTDRHTDGRDHYTFRLV